MVVNAISMEDAKANFREKMRVEVEALANKQKRFLGSVVVDDLKALDDKIDVSGEIVFKPSKIILAISILIVPTEIAFSLWVIYYIALDSSMLLTTCFALLLTFLAFKTIKQTLFVLTEVIVLNATSITIGKEIYQRDNILDFYFVTYSFSKSVSNSVMVVLVNGEVKEHYISAISTAKANNAIYQYLQHYRATSAQPS